MCSCSQPHDADRELEGSPAGQDLALVGDYMAFRARQVQTLLAHRAGKPQ